MGAVAATLGMILPSFVIIYWVSVFLDSFLEITWIASAFRGIRVAVGIMITDVAVKMIRKMKKKPLPLILMACSLGTMLLINFLSLRFSSVCLMLLAGAVSLAVFLLRDASSAKGGERP